MDEENDSEKTEEPSAKRIEEFRQRGEVASSKELNSVLILFTSILTIGLSMSFVFEQMANYFEWILNVNYDKIFREDLFKKLVEKTMLVLLKCSGPVLAVSFLVSFLSNVAQIGFLFAPEVLELKLERVNPLSGIKRLFSIRSLVEGLKGILKFVFILSITYFFIKDDLKGYQGFIHMDFKNSFFYGMWVLIKLSFFILLGMTIVAAIDFTYQKMSYQQKLRQSKDAAKRESKEQEGDPEIRQRIRTIQREMAQKRMMEDIPKADVIVTNPTHYSVAIQYNKETMVSPKVIGKGSDHIALKIREIAKKNNVPVVENVPLARNLFNSVKVGEEIPRNLYKAVAEILAFVYKIKQKEKALA